MSDKALHEMLHAEYMNEQFGLTRLECIAKAFRDVWKGFLPHEFIDTYGPMNEIDNKDKEFAKLVVDYWRNHFVTRKMQGENINSPWQQGMIDIVSYPDIMARRSDLRLIVTMPMYTDIQQRWDEYQNIFTSVDKVNDAGFQSPSYKYHVNLVLHDKYEKSTKATSKNKYYIFKDKNTNVLYNYVSRKVHANEQEFLDVLLKYTDGVLKTDVWVMPKRHNIDFTYFKINYFSDIEK